MIQKFDTNGNIPGGFDKVKWLEEALGCPWPCDDWQVLEYSIFEGYCRVETSNHVYLMLNSKWRRVK